LEWKESANSFLVDGLIPRQTSMGYTAWYAHLDIRRLAHVPVQNFLAFLISLDSAFLMFARSAFFAMGPQWTLGLDLYGNPVMTTAMEKFYHFGVTAARFYTPSLLFSRDPLLGTYSTILRFSLPGDFSWFMTRSSGLGWIH